MTDIIELYRCVRAWLDCGNTEMAQLVSDNYYSKLERGKDGKS